MSHAIAEDLRYASRGDHDSVGLAMVSAAVSELTVDPPSMPMATRSSTPMADIS